MMVSRLMLPAVFGTIGFLTCLLVQSMLALRNQGLDLDSFTNAVAGNSTRHDHLPGHSNSVVSQQHLCDQADTLHALLSG